jgi:Ca2+/H+ antiporter, TMEM165/GDT1 family
MLREILGACMLIFIAEMGDKTQILAMAFATKFPVRKVITGIFLGCLLNHGIAVFFGSYISNFIPINLIQIIAGFAFVLFSLWTLKSDEEEEEEEKKSKFGPIFTVAIAFFIGELGDKTQLTAITLASDAKYPAAILCGTVLGMVITGGLGIIAGKKLGDKIPELAVKIIAASVFMIFGLIKIYQSVPSKYFNMQNIFIFLFLVSLAIYIMVKPLINAKKQGKLTLLKKKSGELYRYYHKIEKNIDEICLGSQICGNCQGKNCIVGYTKLLVKKGLEDDYRLQENDLLLINTDTLRRSYNKQKVLESLRITLEFINREEYSEKLENIHEIRKRLETILFNSCIQSIESWEGYRKSLTLFDKETASKLFDGM